MILTIKHRFSIYKRFEYDIWGLFFSRMSYRNRLSKFFYKIYLKKEEFRLNKKRRYIYRIDIIAPRVKKKYLKKSFVTLRLVKLFYLVLKYRQFRVMARKAARKDVCLKLIIVCFLNGEFYL